MPKILPLRVNLQPLLSLHQMVIQSNTHAPVKKIMTHSKENKIHFGFKLVVQNTIRSGLGKYNAVIRKTIFLTLELLTF